MRLDEVNRKIQVGPEHYAATVGAEAYDSRERWNSYWQQINILLRLNIQHVVEIGAGNGILKWYLESHDAARVTTVDIDPSRKPDIVADASQLGEYFVESSHEAVVAFQVLEHIPFQQFGQLLSGMASISSRYVIISLPVWGSDFRFACGLGRFGVQYAARIMKMKRFKPDNQHLWEVNAKGSSLAAVRAKLTEIGAIVEDFLCPGNSYHRFFVVDISR